jgi:hypothetical protein
MELTQPVGDPDGTVVWQPGTRFEQDDPTLDGLPPGHVRPVVVEVDEPAVQPEPQPELAPSAELGIGQLRARAEALGVKVDGRWSAARLQQEIGTKGDVL